MSNKAVRFEELPRIQSGTGFLWQKERDFIFYLHDLFCPCLKVSCVILPSLIAGEDWMKT